MTMLSFLVVTFASILTVAYSAPTDSCTLNGYTANNGDTFTPPGFPRCIQYTCNDGVSSLTKEGCDSDGQCIDVGGTVDKKCVTYKCSKFYQGGIKTYSVSIVKALCQDKDGVCRKPGDTFKYIIGKNTYSKCTCTVTNNNKVSYSCSG